MVNDMKINFDEIQDTVIFMLSTFKEHKGVEVEIKSDFYWDISMEEIYNPYDEPRNITLGQISDDIIELRRAMKSGEIVPYDLKRLANILIAISIENQAAF